MTTLLRAVLLALTGLIAASLASCGDAPKTETITVLQPWARATSPGATNGAGYMTIVNNGAQAARLVSASTPRAESVEIHTMSIEGGVMRMRPLPDGILLRTGTETRFEPGGVHLMLIGLKEPLRQGDSVPLTLNFEGGVKKEIKLSVESMSATAASGHGH